MSKNQNERMCVCIYVCSCIDNLVFFFFLLKNGFYHCFVCRNRKILLFFVLYYVVVIHFHDCFPLKNTDISMCMYHRSHYLWLFFLPEERTFLCSVKIRLPM